MSDPTMKYFASALKPEVDEIKKKTIQTISDMMEQELKKINYEVDATRSVITTKCPFGLMRSQDKPILVGSVACNNCQHFGNQDSTIRTVWCKNKISNEDNK